MRYYNVDVDEAEILELEGPELMVYSALKTRCKLGPCKDSVRSISKWSRCGGKDTAARCLKSLVERGLVVKMDDGYMVSNMETKVSQAETDLSQIETRVSQVETDLKESSKENINKLEINIKQTNKKGLVGEFEFSKDFIIWWDTFHPLPTYNRLKKKCYDFWTTMMDSEKREFAMQAAPYHDVNEHPYFWLTNEDYCIVNPALFEDKNGEGVAITGEPTWLTGDEQHYRMKNGDTLAFCERPDGNGFGTVSLEDAKKFGLKIVRYMKPEEIL